MGKDIKIEVEQLQVDDFSLTMNMTLLIREAALHPILDEKCFGE